MGKQHCGIRAPLGTCAKGPKRRHKCGEPHMRTGKAPHTVHRCKHCGDPFGGEVR